MDSCRIYLQSYYSVFPYLEFFSAAANFRDKDADSIATGNLEAPPLTGYEGNSHTARIAEGQREERERKSS